MRFLFYTKVFTSLIKFPAIMIPFYLMKRLVFFRFIYIIKLLLRIGSNNWYHLSDLQAIFLWLYLCDCVSKKECIDHFGLTDKSGRVRSNQYLPQMFIYLFRLTNTACLFSQQPPYSFL